MRSLPFTILAIAIIVLSSCSLVTVPVKTAGSVVKTTVKAAGSVAEAPFKAASGGYRHDDRDEKRKDAEEEE